MLSLSPLEESVAFQELIEEKLQARNKDFIEEQAQKLQKLQKKNQDFQKKYQELREKGPLVGGIRVSQQFLGLTVQSDEELNKLSIEKLRLILQDLMK